MAFPWCLASIWPVSSRKAATRITVSGIWWFSTGWVLAKLIGAGWRKWRGSMGSARAITGIHHGLSSHGDRARPDSPPCFASWRWSNGVTPDRGEILVTGANGGVGGVAITLLSKLGYRVAVVTGRPAESDQLKYLGAAEVLGRDNFSNPGKPLGKERWAGAVDVVGSHVLTNVCATTKYGGTVTACGLAGGMEFPATVTSFILKRG